MAQVKPEIETFARIKVVGPGGSGCKAISRMMDCKIKGVDFIAVNTDAQDLHHSNASQKIHVGKNLTKGLGTGMNPEIGRQAAEENRDEIHEALKGADMVFVTCGFGGGTASGTAPIIAETAKDMGALTVAIITKPFSFEGIQRTRIAEEALAAMKDRVDTLITIPNDKLLQIIDRKTSLLNAFYVCDEVLRQGVQGVSGLITTPGLVNVDFNDVKTIMQDAGSALLGVGKATGEDRAVEAAKQAINSPLLEIAIDGAKRVLFNVSGGEDLSLMEINEAASVITESVDPNAKIIFGASQDEETKKGEMKITVIATGFPNNGEVEDSVPTQTQLNDIKPIHRTIRDSGVDSSSGTKDEKPVEAGLKRESAPARRPSLGSDKMFKARVEPVSQEKEDEFDIPAFIRRKLGR